jgi:hypothetical protein
LQKELSGTKDKVIVRLLQDTLDQQGNPFQHPSLIIGIGYEGVHMMEAYQVTNDGAVCEWKFAGNVQV